MKLLHLDSSIQGDASASRALSRTIVDHIRSTRADLDYVYRDLAAEPPAHLTLAAFGAPDSSALLAEFHAADIIVIGAGMYNFTIPSQLKSWLDRILVAGETFRYGPNGPEGLAGAKRVIVALARGGHYGDGSPAQAMEHAETYLRSVFAFIGITAPEFVTADGLALGPESRAAGIAAATKQAQFLTA